jgi:high-affinity nickel-transport protein
MALTGMLAAVLLLGFKHGFDADHLAAIDAIGRLNRQAGRPLAARWSGAQFSIGHSLIVLLAAQLAYQAGGNWLPEWLDATGAWVSIVCLTLIGLLSIRSAGAWRQADAPVLPRWLRPLLPLAVSRWGAAATGAAFALSLDTLTMAAWFASEGARLGGAGGVLLLALTFAAGMVLADGVSGWWVNRLAGASDLQRARGQQIAGWVVGLGALATAGFGVLRQMAVPLDRWADSHALPLGLGLLAATSLALLAAAAFSRTRPG